MCLPPLLPCGLFADRASQETIALPFLSKFLCNSVVHLSANILLHQMSHWVTPAVAGTTKANCATCLHICRIRFQAFLDLKVSTLAKENYCVCKPSMFFFNEQSYCFILIKVVILDSTSVSFHVYITQIHRPLKAF